MNKPTQTEPAADAAGARVDRAVGRPDPGRSELTPLKRRIVDALRGRGRVPYYTLAYELWPPETHGRAWRHATKGGPHGWAMPLGKALGELERAGIVREHLRTEDNPERAVSLKTPNDGAEPHAPR